MVQGLCACAVVNTLAKARGLSLRTGAQTMLYLSLVKRSYPALASVGYTNATIIMVSFPKWYMVSFHKPVIVASDKSLSR